MVCFSMAVKGADPWPFDSFTTIYKLKKYIYNFPSNQYQFVRFQITLLASLPWYFKSKFRGLWRASKYKSWAMFHWNYVRIIKLKTKHFHPVIK